jgi:agmatine/peptidylarginine deiminase
MPFFFAIKTRGGFFFNTLFMMMKLRGFILVMACLSAVTVAAQVQPVSELRQRELAAAVSEMTQEEIRAGYLQIHGRQSAVPAAAREEWMQRHLGTKSGESTPKGTNQLPLPAGLRVPGEFEEVQAIVVTWPYITRDTNNNWAQQWFPGLGPYYSGSTFLGLGPVTSVVDTFPSSQFPAIFRQLINSIEPHAEAWINIWEPQDSLVIKNYMANHGAPLVNARFFVNPGNSFWYRDCGPVGFYFGPNDSIGFLNFEYYGGRPLDDDLPIHIGAATGYPVFTTTIENEGGNILVDGVGTLFTTSAVYGANADTWGQCYLSTPGDPTTLTWTTKPSVNQARVRDSLTHLLNLDRLFVLPALRYDGGTGHIDLYADMWDENTFVFAQYPSVMSHIIDYARIENNINTITAEPSYHGTPFAHSRIPLPTKDNGNWYTSGFDYENYTRSYSNHVIVNKAIIQPVYSNGVTGNVAGMLADLEVLREMYPGYTVIPIDKRAFDGFGGSIHCITKQIPAENPLLILHDPIRGSHTQTTFTVEAEIRNHSGIQSATLFWRHKGGSWNQVSLTNSGSNIWNGQITGNAGAFADTAEYYISASSNNGKTITKPMTAPDGFYTFAYGSAFISVPEINNITSIHVSELFPNPASDKVFVQISAPENTVLNVDVFDALGRTWRNETVSENIYILDATPLPSGIWFVRFSHQNGFSALRKLIVP